MQNRTKLYTVPHLAAADPLNKLFKAGYAPAPHNSPTGLGMTSMLDRFFTCDCAGCVLPTIRGLGPCERCSRHFCLTHRRPPSHTCDDTVRPINNHMLGLGSDNT